MISLLNDLKNKCNEKVFLLIPLVLLACKKESPITVVSNVEALYSTTNIPFDFRSQIHTDCGVFHNDNLNNVMLNAYDINASYEENIASVTEYMYSSLRANINEIVNVLENDDIKSQSFLDNTFDYYANNLSDELSNALKRVVDSTKSAESFAQILVILNFFESENISFNQIGDDYAYQNALIVANASAEYWDNYFFGTNKTSGCDCPFNAKKDAWKIVAVDYIAGIASWNPFVGIGGSMIARVMLQ